MSALYLRFPGKDQLLLAIAARNLRTFIEISERYLDEVDAATALVGWMHELLQADTLRLGSTLAGTFEATAELEALAATASDLSGRIVMWMHESGVLPANIVSHDLELMVEAIGAVKIGEGQRQRDIRGRLLTLALHGILAENAEIDLAPPPSTNEMIARWQRSSE